MERASFRVIGTVIRSNGGATGRSVVSSRSLVSIRRALIRLPRGAFRIILHDREAGAMSCGRSTRTQPEESTNQEFIFSREYRAPKLVERLGDYLARSRPLCIAVSAHS